MALCKLVFYPKLNENCAQRIAFMVMQDARFKMQDARFKIQDARCKWQSR